MKTVKVMIVRHITSEEIISIQMADASGFIKTLAEKSIDEIADMAQDAYQKALRKAQTRHNTSRSEVDISSKVMLTKYKIVEDE